MPRPIACLSLAVLGLVLASPVAAEEASGLGDVDLFGWTLSNARVGVRIAPDYLGSDEFQATPTGSLTLSRGGAEESFGAPDDGASLGLVGTDRWSAGLSARLRRGRDNDGDLQGFEKVDWSVEAGGFLNLWPMPWLRLRGEIRHGFGGHDSWVGDVSADLVHETGPWLLSIGPRLSVADADFTRTFFGVSALEASRSPFGIGAYAPDGRMTWGGALANAELQVSPRWNLVAVGSYRRLMGDAARSPIVARLGDKDQFSATLSVRYRFGP